MFSSMFEELALHELQCSLDGLKWSGLLLLHTISIVGLGYFRAPQRNLRFVFEYLHCANHVLCL